MATITLAGNEIHTNGELPALGQAAPDFKLVDKDLNDVSLAAYSGKKKLLNIVPRLHLLLWFQLSPKERYPHFEGSQVFDRTSFHRLVQLPPFQIQVQ